MNQKKKSAGDLEGNENTAKTFYYMMQEAQRIISKTEKEGFFNRLTSINFKYKKKISFSIIFHQTKCKKKKVAYESVVYGITLAGGKIYVVKKTD